MGSTELAWAAGFFDGEGSSLAQRHTQPRGRGRVTLALELSVQQVDPRPLRRFAAAVGVGTLHEVKSYRSRQRPSWRWRARGLAAEQALLALWPYLGEPKREQALAAVDRVYAAYVSRVPSKHWPHAEYARWLAASA